MNWIDQVASEFGQRIGISELTLDERKGVHLQTLDEAGFGFFLFEEGPQPEVVVYRSTSANYLSAPHYRAALQVTNFRFPHPWPLQAACDQRELIIAARIPERSFMVSSLEIALEDLGKILDNIRSAS